MKIVAFLLLSATLVLANQPEQDNVPAVAVPVPSEPLKVTAGHVTSLSGEQTGTAKVTTAADTTTVKTTTPSTTTTSTTLHTTTTVKPTTTITPSTTTTITPFTTTIGQSTTTNAPTSTTPVPAPTAGTWTVNTSNVVCVVLHMAAQMNVTIGPSGKQTMKIIDLPSDAKSTGVCGQVEQNITISWPAAAVANQTTKLNDSLTLHFVQNDTQKRYALHCVELTVVDVATNITNTTVFIHDMNEFSTALTNSYRCMRRQDLPLKVQGQNDTVGFISITDLQFQAFRGDNATVFGLAKDCAFDAPDVVPIAVGCALAALVVVVLIAYLVGRRRTQQGGYVSM